MNDGLSINDDTLAVIEETRQLYAIHIDIVLEDNQVQVAEKEA